MCENMDIYIMEKAYKEYTRWCRQRLPEDLAAELCAIRGDENEIYNRFCKDISFGTSGLRAKMGAGSNRINSVTLRKASIGISRYLNEKGTKPELVIGFDTRNNARPRGFVCGQSHGRFRRNYDYRQSQHAGI